MTDKLTVDAKRIILYCGSASEADGEQVKAQLVAKSRGAIDVEVRPGYPPADISVIPHHGGGEGALVCVMERGSTSKAPH